MTTARLMATAQRERWTRLRQATAHADADTQQEAMARALEYEKAHPDATDEELEYVAWREVGNLQRKSRRHAQRERPDSVAVDAATASALQGARDLRRLDGENAATLCRRLERYQRDLVSLLESGALIRDPLRERRIYRRGARLITEHGRRTGAPEPEFSLSRQDLAAVEAADRAGDEAALVAALDAVDERIMALAPKTPPAHAAAISDARLRQIVDSLVAFRVAAWRSMMCLECSPFDPTDPRPERWTECKHTRDVDMRGRGPRRERARLSIAQISRRRMRDAAGCLMTRLLVLCGVDPCVRHVLPRRKAADFKRRFDAFQRSQAEATRVEGAPLRQGRSAKHRPRTR